MKRGIIIIAIDHSLYFQYALNLAISIKLNEPDLPITLLWQGKGRSHIEPWISIFDGVIEIDSKYTTKKGLHNPLRSKMYIYDLSPYKETIFLDADIILNPFKRIGVLFDEFNDIDFTMANRGKNDLELDPNLLWVKSSDLKNVYGNKEVYNLSSEFIYFKKTTSVKKLFTASKLAFEDPKLNYVRFSGGVPDELAFQIGMMETGVEPHKSPYLPGYWNPTNRNEMKLQEFYRSEFYWYSVGGSVLSANQQLIYNTIAKSNSVKFGMRYSFPCKSKREVIANRSKI